MVGILQSFRDFSPRVAAAFLVIVAASLLWVRYPGNRESFRLNGPPTDFAVYTRAWERVEARQNPYVLTDPSPYKYSPGALGLV
jgi:hypothetical protein